MVNAFCLYKEWYIIRHPTKHSPRHSDFRLSVIKQLLSSTIDTKTHVGPDVTEYTRFTCRHFIQKIPVPEGKKKVHRSCVVCVPANRKINKRSNIDKKCCSKQTCYQCKPCQVAMCAEACFEYYRTQKDYITKYINDAR